MRHDQPAGIFVHVRVDELLWLHAPVLEDPELRVARSGDLAGRLEHALEHCVEVELGRQTAAHLEQAASPQLLGSFPHPQMESWPGSTLQPDCTAPSDWSYKYTWAATSADRVSGRAGRDDVAGPRATKQRQCPVGDDRGELLGDEVP